MHADSIAVQIRQFLLDIWPDHSTLPTGSSQVELPWALLPIWLASGVVEVLVMSVQEVTISK
jgi:hypothetical protein